MGVDGVVACTNATAERAVPRGVGSRLGRVTGLRRVGERILRSLTLYIDYTFFGR